MRARGIIESPYSRRDQDPAYPLQFPPPQKASQLTSFNRALFAVFGEFPGALLVFTDWAHYRPDEMVLMDSLRRGNGERRPLIEAPGHLFEPTEQMEAIGFCHLALIFGWSAYLYLASGAVTVLFWEGELIDVWCTDKDVSNRVRGVVEAYGLRTTF